MLESGRAPRTTERRAWLVAALVATAVLAGPAGTAGAKGPGLDYTLLRGPGIEGAIRIRSQPPYLLNDAIGTHMFPGGDRRRDPHAGELGPRYRLAYDMRWGKRIGVDLYPYAAGGPVAFVPAGQRASVPIGRSGERSYFEVNPGWYDYGPRLIADLRKRGLPGPDAGGGDGNWGRGLLGLAGAGAVIGGAWRWRRLKRMRSL